MQVIPAITPLNGSLSVADVRRLSPYLHASITFGGCGVVVVVVVGGSVAVTVAEPAAVPGAKQLNVCQKNCSERGGEDSSIKSHSWLCSLNTCVHVHVFVFVCVCGGRTAAELRRSPPPLLELGPETMTLGNVIPSTGAVRQ